MSSIGIVGNFSKIPPLIRILKVRLFLCLTASGMIALLSNLNTTIEGACRMGIGVTWDNEANTIILMTFEGRWTWDELQEAVNLCNGMVESVPHHVHYILDRKGAHYTPGNLLENMRKIINLFTPNEGLRMIVGENPLIKEAILLFTKLNKGQMFPYRHADTVEEARAYLEKQPVKLKSVDSSS